MLTSRGEASPSFFIMSGNVLIEEPSGEQYWRKPEDVKPGDVVLHGAGIPKTQAEQLVAEAQGPKATFGGGYKSPEETKQAVKSLATKGWNVTGIEQDPRTGEWKIVTHGQKDPEYVAKIKAGSGTPVQKAVLIRKESEKLTQQIKVDLGERIETGPVAQPSTEGKFIYSMGVDYPEQVRDVRTWAAGQGHVVTVLPGKEEGRILLEISTEKQLDPGVSVDIRSEEMIRAEKAERAGKVLGPKIYEKADPGTRILLHVRTLLSPAGYEYVGSAVKTFFQAEGPAGASTVYALDKIFPGIKPMDTVVKENLSEHVRRQELNLKHRILGVEIPEELVSAVHNPATDIGLMFLGGAGLGKFALTKIGGKILGHTATKAGLIALAGGYVVERSMKVQSLRAKGKGGEALGTAATAITGLAAGIVGFKTQISYSTPKAVGEVKITASEMRGVSFSKQIGKETSISRGKFEITKGDLAGLRGGTAAVTGKKGGFTIVKIPAQKVGKIKVPEQIFRAFSKHGKISDKLKLYWKESGEGVVTGKKLPAIRRIAEGSKAKGFLDTSDVKIIGRQRGYSVSREISQRPGKIKGTDVMIRKFKALGVGTKADKYGLYLIRRGNKFLMVEQSVLGKKHLAKIDWVDISPLSKPGPPVSSYRAGGPATKTTTKPSAGPPTPPTLQIKTQAPKIEPVLGARIVPNVNPVPMGVRIKRVPKKETVQLSVETGRTVAIIRPTAEKERQKGRTVTPGAQSVLIVKTPRIIRQEPKQTPVVITHPITGVEITQKERSAILQKLEPIIDRIPSQPVEVPTAPVNRPPPPFMPWLGMIPFLRMGKIDLRRLKFMTGTIKNPVPDIEKVI